MTDPTPNVIPAATDERLDEVRAILADVKSCDLDPSDYTIMECLARIDADRRLIAEQAEAIAAKDAEIARLREALEDIRSKAAHFIPPYAYGDNEAGCDFANRLQEIETSADAALAAQVRRYEDLIVKMGAAEDALEAYLDRPSGDEGEPGVEADLAQEEQDALVRAESRILRARREEARRD